MSFDRVLKFGGAALADGPSVRRACEIIAAHGGSRPAVVVSAHHGVTDLLEIVGQSALEGVREGDRVRIRHRSLLKQLDLEPELLDRYFNELFSLLAELQVRGRMLQGQHDHLLSFGERMSARIVAHTLKGMGLRATPIDAWDIGLVSDSNHGAARPLPGTAGSMRSSLEQVTGIPVITGFLARDTRGALTTLGRNGSDLTAALIAEAVGAGELQLWKSVAGIMTADPELESNARVVERVSYQEASEYSFHGADVLYGPALAPAQRARLTVRILDVNTPEAPGTLLETRSQGVGPIGLAARREVVRIDLSIDPGEQRIARQAELFGVLARHRIEPGLVSTSAERFSVIVSPSPALQDAVAELGRGVVVQTNLASVAVIGKGLGEDATLASHALLLLLEARVPVIEAFCGTRQPSLVFVVAASDLQRAVQALHAGFLRPTHALPLVTVV